jgi:tetratricopeptide (TPR) repeat protein
VFVNHEYGFTLVETGKLQDAEETFDKMLSRDAAKKARGHRSLALLRMYQGKYEAAIPHLKEAILLNKSLQSPLSELRDRLFLARVYRLKGIKAGFEAELHAASQIHAATAMSPDWSLYLGTIYAREGRLQEARLVLEKAERAINNTVAISSLNRDARRDRAVVETLKAEVELARSKSARVTESLEVAYRLFPDPITLEPLAYAYQKIGNQDEAVRKYKELVETPRLGSESQEDWILAHYQLGKLFQQAGDLDNARRYYEKLLLIWKDGDADLPVIVDAKKQLIRLPRT